MYRHIIEVEARFVDNLTSQAGSASDAIENIGDAANDAAKDVDNLGKKKAKPQIDAEMSEFLRKMNQTDDRLNKFSGKEHKSKLSVIDKATKVITAAHDKAKRFADKVYKAAIGIKDTGAYRAISKITGAAETLTKKAWRVGVTVVDKATAPLRTIKNALFNIKTLIGAITAGLAANQFIIKPIGLADQYSSARIGFSTLLGESAGQQMMNNLDEFAARTPFSTSQVIAQSQRMIAMGWDAESIIKDMETIGDAAAATGKGEEGLGRIVLALSQIKTKGRLSTEELNQLAEAGISAKRYLAEGLGYGTGDAGIAAMTAELEDGAIGSEAALAALLEGMKEYKGMMDKTANETVTGLKSQISDAFEINVFRKWGQGLQDGAKRGFGTVVELLDKAKSALSQFGDMLYEIGKTASNWSADKFQNAVSRILEITDSFEFRNAGLKDKVKMLWNGVIVDPIKEWWEGGGREKTVASAGKVGKWIGETLTKGLLAILGMTDVFKKGGIDESDGVIVARSFVKGFVEGFDVSAITKKLSEAISNVWGALPTWAKVLIVGYGGGKLALAGMNAFNTIGSFIGTSGTRIGGQVVGASGLLGAIGKTGVYGVGGTGILGGLSKLGYGASGLIGGTAGKAALLGVGGGTAALAGAGAIATGAGVIKSGVDFYQAYKADKSGDRIERNAKLTSGGSTLAGAGVGAAIGTAILPGVGTLIGAGLGTAIGWFAGDKIANNIRQAKYETEGLAKELDKASTEEEKAAKYSKALWESAKEHFGDIALSVEEIARLADQIVWGDDLESFEKFTAATKNAEANLTTLKNAASTTDKWMWKAGLGVKFNDDEKESIVAAFDEYITAAQSYIENKHYEFTTSASLLLDLESEEGKSVLESGNAYYAQIKEQLAGLGSELSDKINSALEDGVISTEPITLPDGTIQLSEMDEIISLQNQIAEITQKVADAESQAELELIKVKFGNGNLDIDSFDKFMQQMETTLNERVSTADDAFKLQVSNLKMQLNDGAISQEEYNAQLQTLISGYKGKVESIQAEVMGVELGITGDAYSSELGSDAAEDLQNALQYAINEGLDPIEISDEKLAELLNVEKLSAETADNIKDMLNGVLNQVKILEIDGDLLLKIGSVKTEGDAADKIKGSLAESVTEAVGVNTKGYAAGGIVRGGARLVTVAEEGTPEMIIPLGVQRRGRGLKLWEKAGEMLGVNTRLATGGTDEDIRHQAYDSDSGTAGGNDVQVDVGGVTVNIQVDARGEDNVVDAIKARSSEIAETVAGLLAESLDGQFTNTPLKGGAS